MKPYCPYFQPAVCCIVVSAAVMVPYLCHQLHYLDTSGEAMALYLGYQLHGLDLSGTVMVLI